LAHGSCDFEPIRKLYEQANILHSFQLLGELFLSGPLGSAPNHEFAAFVGEGCPRGIAAS
jgi:hypothetical protein